MKKSKTVIVEWLLCVIVLFTVFGLATTACAIGNRVTSNSAVQAVSLRGLQEKLQACQNRADCPSKVMQFEGLTHIMGYLIDRPNHDIILFGRALADRPPLNVEHFIIALRNTKLKYAPLQNNTYHYGYLGTSIDPDPGTFNELERIAQRILSNRDIGQIESELKQWDRVCTQPQSVRMMGVPFDSDFARVMVDADYSMKRLADGMDAVDIPGFMSLMDIKFDAVGKAVQNNQAPTISIGGMNRFWFYPGEQWYEKSQDIVLLVDSPVLLQTEASY